MDWPNSRIPHEVFPRQGNDPLHTPVLIFRSFLSTRSRRYVPFMWVVFVWAVCNGINCLSASRRGQRAIPKALFNLMRAGAERLVRLHVF